MTPEFHFSLKNLFVATTNPERENEKNKLREKGRGKKGQKEKC